jgi:exopolyphosphatase/guanosine-5'-triphosphate,3'-diphosphate pyrophosphatase
VIVLTLPQDLKDLASDRLSNRLRGLGRLLGVEARIEIAA